MAEVIYGIPEESKVSLSVYNALGARVALIEDRVLSPGFYEVRLDLHKEGFTSGIYWLILRQGG